MKFKTAALEYNKNLILGQYGVDLLARLLCITTVITVE